MVGSHYNREALERFVDGVLTPEEARQVERHLEGCSDCRDRADAVSFLVRLQNLESWLYPCYDDALEGAAAQAAGRLEGLLIESRSTEDLFAELMRETPYERRRRIRSDERFHSLKLCQFVQERSREARFADPSVTLEMADLAVVVAQHLDTGRYGSSLVEDARALSLGYLGNAFRIISDLWQAEQAFRQAWIHHMQAGGDPSTEAELLSLTSSLRGWQGRIDEAVRLSDRAINIYREGQDLHLEGATLIHQGLMLAFDNRFQDAIPITRLGLSRIQVDRDPHLLLSGWHNLMCLLSKIGEPKAALNLLEKNRFLYEDLGGPIMQARLEWTEAEIASTLGQFVAAEHRLQKTRDFFLESRLGAEVVACSLDLAEIYLRNRRAWQAIKVLNDAIPLGEALGLRRNVIIGRLLYWQVSRS